jgi:hypothetical protein
MAAAQSMMAQKRTLLLETILPPLPQRSMIKEVLVRLKERMTPSEMTFQRTSKGTARVTTTSAAPASAPPFQKTPFLSSSWKRDGMRASSLMAASSSGCGMKDTSTTRGSKHTSPTAVMYLRG